MRSARALCSFANAIGPAFMAIPEIFLCESLNVDRNYRRALPLPHIIR